MARFSVFFGVLATLAVGLAAVRASEPDAETLFLQALRHSAMNPACLSSGRLSVTATSERPADRRPNDARRYDAVFEYQGAFELRRLEVFDSSKTSADKWNLYSAHLSACTAGETVEGLSWNSRRPEATFGRWPLFFPFRDFGRLHGQTPALIAAALAKSDGGERQFPLEEDINKLRAKLDTYLRSSGQTLRVVGKEETEGGTSYVVEVFGSASWLRGNHSTSYQAWIDAGRGYICPRIDERYDGKPTRTCLSSNFFKDEASGLWAPRRFISTSYENGVKLGCDTFELEPNKTAYNVSIDPLEFEFPIRLGMRLTDSRDGDEVAYLATKEATLRLSDKKTDLTKNDSFALTQSPNLSSRSISRNSSRQETVLTVLVFVSLAITGVVVIVAARK